MLPLRRPAHVLAVATWLVLGGCVSYRQGLVPANPSSATAAGSATTTRSVAVLVSVQRKVNDDTGVLPADYVERWKQAVVAGFQDAGVFAEVKRGLGSADLQARVNIVDHTRASRGLTYLAGMSFLVVPLLSRDDFTMTTTLSAPEGGVIATFEKRERVTTIYQILLAPLMLVASRNRVFDSAVRSLALATAQEVQVRGL
jgi:hypothetical protein